MSETVEFKDVVYTYPNGAFTLSVDELILKTDEATFVTGDNGSGKTTLAKLMTGILKPLKGEILVMGARIDSLSLGGIGKRIGYLWQNPRQQLFAQSVIDELTFAEEMKNPKMPQKEKEAAAEDALKWLEYFGLAEMKDKNCFYLSHGEKQRLALAAVLASGAKYLVLDEPAKGLDGKRKNMLIDILKKLRYENGVGMCVISHDEKFTAELKERVITLSEGKVSDDRI